MASGLALQGAFPLVFSRIPYEPIGRERASGNRRSGDTRGSTMLRAWRQTQGISSVCRCVLIRRRSDRGIDQVINRCPLGDLYRRFFGRRCFRWNEFESRFFSR